LKILRFDTDEEVLSFIYMFYSCKQSKERYHNINVTNTALSKIIFLPENENQNKGRVLRPADLHQSTKNSKMFPIKTQNILPSDTTLPYTAC
jgi:hypothetical protein